MDNGSFIRRKASDVLQGNVQEESLGQSMDMAGVGEQDVIKSSMYC
jgi:hypothetical protein